VTDAAANQGENEHHQQDREEHVGQHCKERPTRR
jgi:hypothetical protein